MSSTGAEPTTVVERPPIRESRWWLPGLVVVALLASALLYPGRWTPDTAAQRDEIASGNISDWYAPLFNGVVRLVYLVVPHVGLLLGAQLVGIVLGVYGVSRALFSPRGAALVTAVCLAWPPVLGWTIVLSRDVWYGAFVLGLAAALRPLLLEHPSRVQAWSLGTVAAVCATFAVAVRQNGAIGILPLAALASWFVLGLGTSPRVERLRRPPVRAVVAVAVGILLVGLIGVGVRLTAYHVIHAERAHIERTLYIYDTAAISKRTGRNFFGAAVLADARFAELEHTFDPANVDSVLWGNDALFDLRALHDSDALRSNWAHAVSAEWVDYLAARWFLFSRLAGITGTPAWTYQPLEASATLARPLADRPNRLVDRYLDAFSASAIQRPLSYAGVVLLFVIVGWRRGLRYQVVAALGIGAMLYFASFAFLGTVVGNRFSWLLLVSGVICSGGLLSAGTEHLRRSLDPRGVPSR